MNRPVLQRMESVFNQRLEFFLLFVACADAYLTPCIRKYVGGFSGGFERELEVNHLVHFAVCLSCSFYV